MRYLGESFDIHTGGVDLVFPHHEDEIAQSEAATGKPFVRTWLHCAHLQMGGRKMAKSEGNIARVADLLADGHLAARPSLRAPRCPLPDGPQLQRRIAGRRDRGRRAPGRARGGAGGLSTPTARTTPPCRGVLAAAREAFGAALDDDLGDLARAGARVFDLVRDLNRRIAERTLSTARCRRARSAALRDLDAVLGLLPDAGGRRCRPDLAALLEARAAARAARDWAASDRLRDELAAAGILVEDSRDGQRWRRAGRPPGA